MMRSVSNDHALRVLITTADGDAQLQDRCARLLLSARRSTAPSGSLEPEHTREPMGFGSLRADVLSHCLEFLHVVEVCGVRIDSDHDSRCNCMAVSKTMRAAARVAMRGGRFKVLKYVEVTEELVTRAECEYDDDAVPWGSQFAKAVATCRAEPLRAAWAAAPAETLAMLRSRMKLGAPFDGEPGNPWRLESVQVSRCLRLFEPSFESGGFERMMRALERAMVFVKEDNNVIDRNLLERFSVFYGQIGEWAKRFAPDEDADPDGFREWSARYEELFFKHLESWSTPTCAFFIITQRLRSTHEQYGAVCRFTERWSDRRKAQELVRVANHQRYDHASVWFCQCGSRDCLGCGSDAAGRPPPRPRPDARSFTAVDGRIRPRVSPFFYIRPATAS